MMRPQFSLAALLAVTTIVALSIFTREHLKSERQKRAEAAELEAWWKTAQRDAPKVSLEFVQRALDAPPHAALLYEQALNNFGAVEERFGTFDPSRLNKQHVMLVYVPTVETNAYRHARWRVHVPENVTVSVNASFFDMKNRPLDHKGETTTAKQRAFPGGSPLRHKLMAGESIVGCRWTRRPYAHQGSFTEVIHITINDKLVFESPYETGARNESHIQFWIGNNRTPRRCLYRSTSSPNSLATVTIRDRGRLRLRLTRSP